MRSSRILCGKEPNLSRSSVSAGVPKFFGTKGMKSTERVAHVPLLSTAREAHTRGNQLVCWPVVIGAVWDGDEFGFLVVKY